jgi:hypothetical protein
MATTQPLKTLSPDEEKELAQRGNDYILAIAKRFGIRNLDEPVTEEERERVRQSLSKGDALSKIVIENRGEDD